MLYKQPFSNKRNYMEYAVEKAHSYNIELHAQIKLFETGICSMVLPHTFPEPEGVLFFSDFTGIHYAVDPFVVKNPHMRFKRRPGIWNPPGKISCIKLIKSDEESVDFKPNELEIWIGEKNGSLEKYKGSFKYSENIEWRIRDNIDYKCRILCFDDLSIDEKYRYIFIKYNGEYSKACFENTIFNIMEIYKEDGDLIPSTPARGSGILPEKVSEARWSPINYPMDYLTEYGKSQRVKRFLSKPDRVKKAFEEFYLYDNNPINETVVLENRGYVGVARGKNEYVGAAVNTIYPEVQEYLMSIVKYVIECGVDGVNFRMANHSVRTDEEDEYGFNSPAIEKCGSDIDRGLLKEVNGDALTKFLTEAKNEISRRNLCTTIHINVRAVYPNYTFCNMPPNTELQWEKWINIADVVYLKDMHFLSNARADYFIDKVTNRAKKAGKKVIYVGNNRPQNYLGGNKRLEYEIDKALRHKRIDGYNLYEVASYTRLNKSGHLVDNTEISDLIKKIFD
jgi:hypothetical protein